MVPPLASLPPNPRAVSCHGTMKHTGEGRRSPADGRTDPDSAAL